MGYAVAPGSLRVLKLLHIRIMVCLTLSLFCLTHLNNYWIRFLFFYSDNGTWMATIWSSLCLCVLFFHWLWWDSLVSLSLTIFSITFFVASSLTCQRERDREREIKVRLNNEIKMLTSFLHLSVIHVEFMLNFWLAGDVTDVTLYDTVVVYNPFTCYILHPLFVICASGFQSF